MIARWYGRAVFPASTLIYDFQRTDFHLAGGEIVDHGAAATERNGIGLSAVGVILNSIRGHG